MDADWTEPSSIKFLRSEGTYQNIESLEEKLYDTLAEYVQDLQ